MTRVESEHRQSRMRGNLGHVDQIREHQKRSVKLRTGDRWKHFLRRLGPPYWLSRFVSDYHVEHETFIT